MELASHKKRKFWTALTFVKYPVYKQFFRMNFSIAGEISAVIGEWGGYGFSFWKWKQVEELEKKGEAEIF